MKTDIDIDVADRSIILENIPHVISNLNNKKHNTGVYFQKIPSDPRTDLATISNKEAADLGYFKIDILNNSVYEQVRDEEHLNILINTEPMWELFLEKEVVEQLFHISNQINLLKKLKPRSVEDLAMILALMRPGKFYLQDNNWNVIRDRIWIKENNNKYIFKKSHAISYAIVIIVQLNIIIEELTVE